MRGQNRMPDHAEGGEVDLGVAVGVGVVLFEVEVALVVEHAVEHEGRVAVGALARLLEVDAEPEVVLDLDEPVGQPDGAAAGVQPAVQLGEAVRLRRVGRLGRVRLQPPPVVVERDLPFAACWECPMRQARGEVSVEDLFGDVAFWTDATHGWEWIGIWLDGIGSARCGGITTRRRRTRAIADPAAGSSSGRIWTRGGTRTGRSRIAGLDGPAT